jgi:hypothetical protein
LLSAVPEREPELEFQVYFLLLNEVSQLLQTLLSLLFLADPV